MREKRSRLSWEQMRDRLDTDTARIPKNPSAWKSPWDLSKLWDLIYPRRYGLSLAIGGTLALLLALLPGKQAFLVDSGLRAKGATPIEVRLMAGEKTLESGASSPVRNGEILSFSFRSAESLFVRIWYSEDGGSPRYFGGRIDPNLNWPSASSWTRAPQRIQVDGNWKSQEIWVLVSTDSLPSDIDPREFASTEKTGNFPHLFTYRLDRH
jgi:hypothetical protein